MKRMVTRVNALLLGLAVLAGAGCARIHEPWDQTSYFKSDRHVSAAQETRLKERALRAYTQRASGFNEFNY